VPAKCTNRVHKIIKLNQRKVNDVAKLADVFQYFHKHWDQVRFGINIILPCPWTTKTDAPKSVLLRKYCSI
jgi:hypothetical protein